jgi:hypothetical protein
MSKSKVIKTATLSVYNDGIHFIDKKKISGMYAMASIVETLILFEDMLDEIIGKDFKNIGKKIKITMEIVKKKISKSKEI